MSSLLPQLPQPELQQQFARRRVRQLLLVVPVFVAILALRTLDGGTPPFGLSSDLVGAVSLVFIFGAVAFSFWNWRCPACSKYLGRSINPKFCAKCGCKLQA